MKKIAIVVFVVAAALAGCGKKKAANTPMDKGSAAGSAEPAGSAAGSGEAGGSGM